MMRKPMTLSLVLFFAAISCCMAQPRTQYGQSDPQAKAILDAVSAKFKTYSSVKADFELKITTTDNKVLDTKKGTVLLKGGRYHVTLDDQEVFCDGKTVWTYNKDTKEVQVNDYQPAKGAITPSNMFSDFYDKQFLYRLRATSKLHGRPVDVIEMTPLDKSRPYFKVIALVDKKDKNLLSAEIFEKGGNRYTYEVTKFTPNAPAPDSAFVFNKKDHPGVDVVDLR
jgi:outer membrane lipoprotein-sorting protein